MAGQQHLEVTQLRPDEYAAAGRVLGRAFETDPLWTAVLTDSERRPETLVRMFTALTKATAVQGRPEQTPDLGGIALWHPPGKDIGLWAMVRSGSALPRFVMSLGKPERKRMIGTLRQIGGRKKVLMPEPHWYVSAIGVEPERQGQGVGSALMQHAIARADRDGVPIYLETESESNVGFYRNLGFAVIEEIEVVAATVPIWLMSRPAAT